MKNKIYVLLLLMLCGIMPSKSQETSQLANTVDTIIIIQMVNKVRARGCKCGQRQMKSVPPLKWSSKLQEAAQMQSDDMYEKHYFSHTRPDSLTLWDKMDSVGIRTLSCGENISEGFDSEKSSIEGWLQSPGHCANIMRDRYRRLGVARKGKYWTMVLAE